jgi:ABC-type glycerol-3-phosphate transport system substrate-binding protein
VRRGHEVSAQGWRWESHDGLDAAAERDRIARTVAAIAEATGVRPVGWHTRSRQCLPDPPEDLTPVLDTPDAIGAAEVFASLLHDYGPDGVISYTYEQVVATLTADRANYSPNGQIFLEQMGAKDGKVANTCNVSMCPAGPKGRFPGVATHGWGIPAGSKNKDAAWQFITWAMSKPLIQRMVVERGYSSITRRSLIDSPEFKGKLTVNGHDIVQIYLDSIRAGNGRRSTLVRRRWPSPRRRVRAHP